MFVVMVYVHVKLDSIEAFKQATVTNAQSSLQEPGIVRFDFIQQQEDPARFLLIEVYDSEEDTHKHKQTEHYQTWRDTVAAMMAEPREGVRYDVIYPEEKAWWPA
jgi:autoinducer 2-degrading protein